MDAILGLPAVFHAHDSCWNVELLGHSLLFWFGRFKQEWSFEPLEGSNFAEVFRQLGFQDSSQFWIIFQIAIFNVEHDSFSCCFRVDLC